MCLERNGGKKRESQSQINAKLWGDEVHIFWEVKTTAKLQQRSNFVTINIIIKVQEN